MSPAPTGERLAGKVVLITGGTTGIGLATARLFRDEGATVIVTGSNPENVAAVEAELGIEALASDVRSVRAIMTLMEHIRTRHGHLDILFANAGIPGRPLALEDVTEDDFDSVIGVNLRGVFFTCQKALPLMSAGGSIVLTSSIGAHLGMASSPAYGASKAGVRSMGRSLAAALVQRGIRVNTLTPGFFRTPIFQKLGVPEEQLNRFALDVPMQRSGELEEAAQAVLFLASSASSYVTATELRVSGGQTDI